MISLILIQLSISFLASTSAKCLPKRRKVPVIVPTSFRRTKALPTGVPLPPSNSFSSRLKSAAKSAAKSSSRSKPVAKGVPDAHDYFALECLKEHNNRRARSETLDHKPLVNLTYDKKLQESAQEWSNHLASIGRLEHSKGKYGENLYSSSGIGSECSAAVESWFNEHIYYQNQEIGDGNFADYGHFTQLVWPKTTKLGCAYAMKGEEAYITCHYDPPGNRVGICLDVRVRNESRY